MSSLQSDAMKVVIWTKYGPPEGLQIRNVEKPKPGDRDILIRVYATTVTAGDCEARALKFPLFFRMLFRLWFGWTKPRNIVPGQELSGVVESTGKKVNKFKPGDEVVAATLFRMGACAEYICLPETYPVFIRPAGLTFAEAATLPTGGVNALHFLHKAGIRSGSEILIVGAGGSIGVYAIQLAKHYGAIVTAIDAGNKLMTLKTAGADYVVDYQREDFTRNRKTYDAIIDIAGKTHFRRTLKCLTPRGRYVLGNPTFSGMLQGLLTSISSWKSVSSKMAEYKKADLNKLKSLIETGKIKPLIDRRYSLEQTVEAHRYVESGQKKGHVVIEILNATVEKQEPIQPLNR